MDELLAVLKTSMFNVLACKALHDHGSLEADVLDLFCCDVNHTSLPCGYIALVHHCRAKRNPDNLPQSCLQTVQIKEIQHYWPSDICWLIKKLGINIFKILVFHSHAVE